VALGKQCIADSLVALANDLCLEKEVLSSPAVESSLRSFKLHIQRAQQLEQDLLFPCTG
jgi:hypothetical protein